MRIGILTPGHPPEEVAKSHGDYAAMFRSLLAGQGLDFATWDVEGMEFPPSVDAADAWLVGGSRHGVYEDHPFIAPLEGFLRRAWEARRRIVGICFGHQILARALGGRVEKAATGWTIGPQDYALDGGGTIRLNAWHQDQIVRLPGGVPVEVLGRGPDSPHALLRYADRAFTLQPHPEFGTAVVHALARLREGTGAYPDALLRAVRAEAAPALDRPRAARAIGAFLRTGEPLGLAQDTPEPADAR
jgi:GMP synthase (glutamine-hydrolysing)